MLFSLPEAFHPVTAGMSAIGSQPVAAAVWLLRFLVRHTMYWFVGNRAGAGGAALAPLGNGPVAAT